jgi:CheY-like chemotaxis protein
LAEWGGTPDVYCDEMEAVAALYETCQQGAPYHVIVLDKIDARVDALDLAHALHSDPAVGGGRIVVITDVGKRGDGVRAKQVGLSGYLTCPMELPDVARAIAMVASFEETQVTSLVTRHYLAEMAVSDLRVLVAEDNPVNQKVIAGLLKNLGCEVDVVANGQSAVDAVARDDYALVLMDCQMPLMDGYTASARIRDMERSGQHIPIIALTANNDTSDVDACRAAGMDDYLSKPIDVQRLRGLIERWYPGVYEGGGAEFSRG